MTIKIKTLEALKILKASRVLFLQFLIRWCVERMPILDGTRYIGSRGGKFIIDWNEPQEAIRALRAMAFGLYEPHTERVLRKYFYAQNPLHV